MDDRNTSIWNVMAAVAPTSIAGAGEGAATGGPRPAGDSGSSYLESVRKHCDGEEKRTEEEQYELVACGCRCWFCPHCCTGKGLKLRERLIPILETFKGLLMWTFTLDPTLFLSPAEAFEYVRSKRCISQVMRRLHERGFLHSRRYFVVIEWQGNGMPHWHLLVDASHIPFETVCELWNRFRPPSAGPVQGERPAFGSVRFSAPKFFSPRHAANYACAYLIQHPKEGYPSWAMTMHDVHRYSTSRGFWGEASEVEQDDSIEEVETSGDEDECPCCGYEREGVTDHCPKCGWSVLDENALPDVGQAEQRPRRTIAERLADCGSSSVVLRLAECIDPNTGELIVRRQFVGQISMPLAGAAAELERSIEDGKRRLPISRAEYMQLAKMQHHAYRRNTYYDASSLALVTTCFNTNRS